MLRRVNALVVDATFSLLRAWRSSLLALAAIVSAIFVVGALLIASRAAQQTLARWAGAAEMSVFLDAKATAAEREAIERRLRAHPSVADVTHVDAAEARARFARTFPDLAPLLDEAGEGALPASIEARLRRDATLDGLRELAEQLRKTAGVADVRLDQELLGRIGALARGARTLGGVISLILVLAAALAIASVVRLSYVARTDEIEIMFLLGAPLAAIRGPFVVEGALQGGIGASIALVLLAVTHTFVARMYENAFGGAALPFLSGWTVLLFVVAGVAIGALAGLTAVMAERRVVVE